VTDAYSGREQTKAKHFILKRYLQALAFKILRFSDITYIDGFSGPWETKTEDFNDSSFMIAISALKDAQQIILEQEGVRRRIRFFFSETDPKAFAQLQEAVAPFHKPAEGFEIKTYCGKFEDAVSEIQSFIGASFPLIFIDPTGWTGYPFDKIRPLFQRAKCEVLINFMYDFVNRFAQSGDETIIASLDPILGGRAGRRAWTLISLAALPLRNSFGIPSGQRAISILWSRPKSIKRRQNALISSWLTAPRVPKVLKPFVTSNTPLCAITRRTGPTQKKSGARSDQIWPTCFPATTPKFRRGPSIRSSRNKRHWHQAICWRRSA
jgi:three-Cys-motif partner protein